MVWMAHGENFPLRDGTDSGIEPREFDPADVGLAHRYGWIAAEKPAEQPVEPTDKTEDAT